MTATPSARREHDLLAPRTFGRTGRAVSAIGLGTYHLTSDRGVAHDEALDIVRAAYDSGINVFDTAPMYGVGEAEFILATALGGDLLERVVTIDKIGRFEKSILARLGERCYTDPAAMTAQLEHSLRVLGVRRLPVLLPHETDWTEWWPDGVTESAPVLRFLAEASQRDLVGHAGLSVRKPEQAVTLAGTGLFDVALYVHYFNMVWADTGAPAIQAFTEQRMGVAVGAPYRQGLLTSLDPDLPRRLSAERRASVPPGVVRRIEGAQRIAREAGLSMVEMGLRWLLGDPRVHTVVVGPRSARELKENVAWAAQGPLPADVTAALAALTAIEPGSWERG
ncbi:aryl-alcohol dehydrogenase-like predicted oxidoreductase [Amycolatopsis bartoniae]|uniref:D-threo-aldose 1-dehydrogenase n=1 Tax=Amycolatopsis bartoniae TaxID=941986 RepID=A0A8H9IY83_9PSEU|nr:aldo/keto reductase [Amycolatopsis bartoniae]MBB2935543.1 aryl-alcohol dehydrogenase-like predicted oxidoreductase [Amycolatopsis bartoniae]TVT05268.1 aldo/keto reductase [Amycolatopsis bartoniae]GHF76662.1 D-threo-aldose 1-dehydrogenase [Amycolatopsis bartoniae]